MKKALIAALVLTCAAPALAGVFVYSGEITADDPTWTRPLETFSGLSGVGIGVGYDTQDILVDLNGTYDFSSVQDYDGFLFLYQGFDPTNPLVGGIAGDDDGVGGIGTSNFSAALTAGVTYTVVTSSFSPSDLGAYTNTIEGPGNIVPEPASLSLLALAGLLAARRR